MRIGPKGKLPAAGGQLLVANFFVMASRFEFLCTAAAVAISRRRGRGSPAVLRGAVVHDGTRAPGARVDVAVEAGRIVGVGPGLRGSQVIDVGGLVLAPGFVDIHSHGDGTLGEDGRAESLIRQGITTIVAGQDGGSRADLAVPWPSASVNVATMIGLGTVRGAVVGPDDRRATASELTRMVNLVEQAVANGACGASSGLEYPPGGFARPDELVALCRPLAARRLPYATHMRNEDDRLLESIDESIAVARGAGCPLEVSHLKAQGPRNWDRMKTALERIEAARASGLDAAFDIYPYVAYATGLANLFPLWSRDGGTAQFLARLDSDSLRARLRAETEAKVSLIGGWDNVLVSSAPSSGDQAAVGQRLGQYARAKNADPYATTVALLQSHEGQTGMVGFAMSEENVELGLAHPLASVCSDGGAVATDGPTRRGRPHPRSVGTFPRVLGRYVRERKALTLEDAIHKMSARPASRVKLADRGRIAVGMAADLVAFDPATVSDRATFEDPFQYPVGIELVMVNGEVALQNGKRTEGRTGRGLRPTPA